MTKKKDSTKDGTNESIEEKIPCKYCDNTEDSLWRVWNNKTKSVTWTCKSCLQKIEPDFIRQAREDVEEIEEQIHAEIDMEVACGGN